MKSNRLPVAAAGLILCGVASVLAQYQVNSQVANSNAMGSVHYNNNTYLMASEMRNETFQSGALRSEVELNARSVGPMAAGGNAAYIPQAYEQGKSYRTPDDSMGSVRNIPSTTEAPEAVNPALIRPSPGPAPRPMPLSRGPINPGPINPGPLNSGPINHSVSNNPIR